MNLNFYLSSAYMVFKKYLFALDSVIIKGIEHGDFKPNVNPRVFRNVFWELLATWHSGGRSFRTRPPIKCWKSINWSRC